MIQRVEQLLRQIVISTNSTKARNEAASAPTPQLPAPAGGEGATAQTPAPVAGNSVSSIDAQLGDARDARADAAAQLSKAQSQFGCNDGSQYLRGNCGRS